MRRRWLVLRNEMQNLSCDTADVVCTQTVSEFVELASSSRAEALAIGRWRDMPLGSEVSQVASSVLEGLRLGQIHRVFLITSPCQADLEFVHQMSPRIPATLYVGTLRSLVESETVAWPSRASDDQDTFAAQMFCLPGNLRAAFLAGLGSSQKNSVKAVAAMAGVSPRTLERCFKRAGLPSPKKLLRASKP